MATKINIPKYTIPAAVKTITWTTANSALSKRRDPGQAYPITYVPMQGGPGADLAGAIHDMTAVEETFLTTRMIALTIASGMDGTVVDQEGDLEDSTPLTASKIFEDRTDQHAECMPVGDD